MYYNLQKEYMSIKEIAEITGVKEDTLQKRCIRGKYSFRKVKASSRSGLKYEILVYSMEPELQERIMLHGHENMWSKSSELCVNNILAPLPLNIENKPVSQKAKDMALAKFNVISFWNDYKKDKEDLKQAIYEFLLIYNSGTYYSDNFKITGKVSKSSLYRWNKLLNENNGNYYALISNYNYHSSLKNYTTLTDLEKQEFIQIMLNDSKLNVGTAYKIIYYKHQKENKQTKSLATYKRFADFIKTRHNDIFTLSRDGEKALADKCIPSIRRDTAFLEVGDILIADGNKLDFMVVNPFTGRPQRAIWVVFEDWASHDILGSEIMLSENTQCISSALRNSIIKLGKLPKCVYIDNGKAFKSKYFIGSQSLIGENLKGVYSKLGINTTFATPYNGKAKIVERFFCDFVKSCPPCISGYIGNSIKNQPAHLKRNEKFHKELHENDTILTIEQAKEVIEKWLDFYRAQKHPSQKDKTIGEVFESGKGIGVDAELLNELMMSTDTRTVRRCTIRIFNQDYTSMNLYGIEGKVIVKYSLFDISKIKIYTLNGEYLCDASTVVKVNAMARFFGSANDVYTLKQELKQRKQLKERTKSNTLKLVGNGVPFEQIEWAQIPETGTDVMIESLNTKKGYKITCYENLHKFSNNEKIYNI